MTTTDRTPLLIDNCSAEDFDYLCPKSWNALRPGYVESVRHCDVCNRNVYMCRTDDDLKLYDSLGYCVAITPQRLQDRRSPPAAAKGGRPENQIVSPAGDGLPFVGIYRKR